MNKHEVKQLKKDIIHQICGEKGIAKCNIPFSEKKNIIKSISRNICSYKAAKARSDLFSGTYMEGFIVHTAKKRLKEIANNALEHALICKDLKLTRDMCLQQYRIM